MNINIFFKYSKRWKELIISNSNNNNNYDNNIKLINWIIISCYWKAYIYIFSVIFILSQIYQNSQYHNDYTTTFDSPNNKFTELSPFLPKSPAKHLSLSIPSFFSTLRIPKILTHFHLTSNNRPSKNSLALFSRSIHISLLCRHEISKAGTNSSQTMYTIRPRYTRYTFDTFDFFHNKF